MKKIILIFTLLFTSSVSYSLTNEELKKINIMLDLSAYIQGTYSIDGKNLNLELYNDSRLTDKIVKIYPSVKKTLEYLKKNYIIGIVTSKDKLRTEKLIKQYKLNELGGFQDQFVIAADLDLEFKLLKSTPTYFEKAPMVVVDGNGLSHQKVLKTIYESAKVRKNGGVLSLTGAVIWYLLKIGKKVIFSLRKFVA